MADLTALDVSPLAWIFYLVLEDHPEGLHSKEALAVAHRRGSIRSGRAFTLRQAWDAMQELVRAGVVEHRRKSDFDPGVYVRGSS